ncbi:MAG TPA: type II toxin-antitoxin system HipA family toxin [Patescibacteria group bacterium]|nr:type II toxin-antitoxin system HipA family toxin [Patescibacteria group bacterium]
MIRVWADNQPAGLLDRHGERGSAFAYAEGIDPHRAVSMTMPVRLASWDHAWGIHPIFEQNMPEGALRERLRLAFAKATGTFDDFDLLSIVGRSQVGRLRYTAAAAALDEAVPFQAVDEILSHRRDRDLFSYLLEKFAAYSGVSGVQPKVMIRDGQDSAVLAGAMGRSSTSLRGATHIIKLWDPSEYPQLAANEYFCLRVAERLARIGGLEVPRFRLAEDGAALVIDRFDLRADGSYLGVEDFCTLNARGTADKYKGGYESVLFKRLGDFIPGDTRAAELEKLFILFAVNCALRNGDAHLKNFALIYDDVLGTPRLAPVYDIVTTTVYLPKDSMALTLGGSTRWPNSKKLTAVGTLRCGLTPKRAKQVFEEVATAVSETATEMRRYMADHPEFAIVGERMLQEWANGVEQSLGFEPPAWKPILSRSDGPPPPAINI